MTPNAPVDREALLRHVARRLSGFGALEAGDIAAIEKLAGETVAVARGADVAAVIGHEPHLVIGGWACQMRLPSTGRRQIFGFVLPGDVIGSFWRKPEFTFYQTTALTPLVLLSAQALAGGAGEGVASGRLLDAARRAEEHAQHRLFDHIVRLGARDAYSGLAHLLLEFHGRLAAVGMVSGHDFALPVGQRVLAQAMGFSLAHTNHTLQRLTAAGLVSMREETVRLVDPDRLAALAEFGEEASASRSGPLVDISATRRRSAPCVQDSA